MISIALIILLFLVIGFLPTFARAEGEEEKGWAHDVVEGWSDFAKATSRGLSAYVDAAIGAGTTGHRRDDIVSDIRGMTAIDAFKVEIEAENAATAAAHGKPVLRLRRESEILKSKRKGLTMGGYGSGGSWWGATPGPGALKLFPVANSDDSSATRIIIQLRPPVKVPYLGVVDGGKVKEIGVFTLTHTGYQKRHHHLHSGQPEVKYTHPELCPNGIIETAEQFDARVALAREDAEQMRVEYERMPPEARDKLKSRRATGAPSKKKPKKPRKAAGPAARKIVEKSESEYDFSQQCLLYDMIPMLTKGRAIMKRAGESLPIRYSTINGNSHEIISTLFRRTKLAKLLDLTPQQQALLVPQIKLYKVWYKDAAAQINRQSEDIPLNFDDFLSRSAVDSITTSRSGRGAGVGIKNFSWTYDGKNFGDAKTSITAKLELHFQDISSFLGTDDDLATGKPGFVDLIWNRPMSLRQRRLAAVEKAEEALRRCHDTTSGKVDEKSDKYEPELAEVKIVVGWAVPNDSSRAIFDSKMLEAIEEAKEVLFMGVYDHTIKFNQDGTVDIAIDYIARLEGVLKKEETDLFKLGRAKLRKDLEKEIEELIAKQAELSKTSGRAPSPSARAKAAMKDIEKKMEEAKKKLSAAESSALSEKYGSILKELIKSERLYYLDANDDLVGNYVISSDVTRTDKERKKARGKIDKLVGKHMFATGGEVSKKRPDLRAPTSLGLNTLTDSSRRSSSSHTRVSYFFFGDLIDVILKSVPEKARINFLLGPMDYIDHNHKRRSVLLADLPVSLSLFKTWWNNVVNGAGGGRRTTYVASEFIRDILERLILPAVGPRCTLDRCRPIPELTAFNFSLAGREGRDPGTPPIAPIGYGEELSIASERIKEIAKQNKTHKNSSKYFHYYYIAAINKHPESLHSIAHADNARGIYHLILGQDRGLVKEMTFTKTNQPHLAEMAIVGGPGPGQVQRLYEASVNLYGNTLFQLGQYTHLNASPLGLGKSSSPNSRSRLLGIGGYYLVTGITHKISRDGYVTSLKCYPENVYGKTDCCGRSKDGKSKLEELRAKLAKSRHALESSLGGEDPDHAGPAGVLAPSSPGESKKAKKGKLKKAARKAAARKRAREVAARAADAEVAASAAEMERNAVISSGQFAGMDDPGHHLSDARTMFGSPDDFTQTAEQEAQHQLHTSPTVLQEPKQ